MVGALKNQTLPPTIHFHRANREIDFPQSPVYVNVECQDWPKASHPRRCGVSSFGLSGTNCHLVLEEAPQRPPKLGTGEEWNIFTCSAKTRTSLQKLVNRYLDFLALHRDLNVANLCFTANVGRGHYEYRVAVVFRDLQELHHSLQLLTSDPEGTSGRRIFQGRVGKKDLGGITLDLDPLDHRLETLVALAQAYTQGETPVWTRFYSGSGCERVSLPTYPFEGIRCWPELKSGDKSSMEIPSLKDLMAQQKKLLLRQESLMEAHRIKSK